MIRRGPLVWALGLIAVGVVLLLQNTGVIADTVSIWPIVLIAVGAALLLESFAGHRARGGFLVPLVLVGLGVWFLLQDTGALRSGASLWPVILIAVGAGILLEAIPRRSGEPRVTEISIPADGAVGAAVSLQHGAGRLRVSALAGGPGPLLAGTLAGEIDRRDRRHGDRLEIDLRQAWPTRRRGRWGSLDWEVRLSPGVPVDLEVKSGGSNVDLDLGPLRVPNLRLSTGASSVTVALPARGRTTGTISAGAAKVDLRVPPGVAGRIRSSLGLASLDVDRGRFPQTDGGAFASADFDTAEDRVDIALEGGAASFSVR